MDKNDSMDFAVPLVFLARVFDELESYLVQRFHDANHIDIVH